METPQELWRRFSEGHLSRGGVGLDLSRLKLPQGFVEASRVLTDRALEEMRALESGAIANADEKRQVGHYWLRAPEQSPGNPTRIAIQQAIDKVESFSARVHSGEVRGEKGPFRSFLLIGIGGSALGPQLVADALGTAHDRMRPFFFDNTDPDGFDRTLSAIAQTPGGLSSTLTLVISKSGGTKETRNGLLETVQAYRKAGLAFPKHAVAVTGEEKSELNDLAKAEGWLERFPMWDWVGGRTSVTAAVGLLPARLQGVDVTSLLSGAREMDHATRDCDVRRNPAMLLALAWHHATRGRGEKDMVILPYKDRLILLSRYLQQLIMESLGKELDRSGKVVNQGIAVYGNKGSTDQHSYVQQLREGVANFFVTFVETLKDRSGESIEVEPGVTSGDYLLGFLLGTRQALFEKGRESITLTIESVTPETIGALIALFERAVGYYASFVNINAYHQPGVEAGKKAAGRVIELQTAVWRQLKTSRGAQSTAEEIAMAIDAPQEVETIYKVLEHLAANSRGVRKTPGSNPQSHRFGIQA